MALNKGDKLTLTIDGTDYEVYCKKVELVAEDAAFQTFGGGDQDWFLDIEAAQDLSTTSLWSFIWDNAGDDVTFNVAPYGNATVAADKPHVSGTVTVGKRVGVGGTKGEVFTFETRWAVVGTPVLDRTP